MELNKIYSGFRLDRIERIDEINGTAYEMKHEKSGARLIYIDSPDTNKVLILPLERLLKIVQASLISWNTPYFVVLVNFH